MRVIFHLPLLILTLEIFQVISFRAPARILHNFRGVGVPHHFIFFKRDHQIVPKNYHDATQCKLQTDDKQVNEKEGGSSYESSGSVTKGIVSSLTSVSNFLFPSSRNNTPSPTSTTTKTDYYDKTTTSSSQKITLPSTTIQNNNNNPPTTSQELMQRISNEYTQNNYLWTGNIDTSSFRPDCRFTDPTLSFVGVDKFVSNVGSLVPIVEFLLGPKLNCESKLLSIADNKEKEEEDGSGCYIETRWNMIGELDVLPWKPRIDVIGRTKFWYKYYNNNNDARGKDGVDGDDSNDNSDSNSNNNELFFAEDRNNNEDKDAVQVYFYDEMWEIPAGLALLQLVTPARTIPNTNAKNIEII